MKIKRHQLTIKELYEDGKNDLAEQKRKQNKNSQQRFRKLKQLKKFGNKFLQRLTLHTPAKMSDAEYNLTIQKIYNFINLPYKWNDTDYNRAFASLRNLQRKTFNDPPALDNLQGTLLSKIQTSIKNETLTISDKVNLITELFKNIGQEMLLQYGNNLDTNKNTLLFILAQETISNYPQWLPQELFKVLRTVLTAQDMLSLAKDLYLFGKQELADSSTLNDILQTDSLKSTDDFGNAMIKEV